MKWAVSGLLVILAGLVLIVRHVDQDDPMRPLPADVVVTVAGHHEISHDRSGRLVPRVLGHNATVQLCLQPPSTTDTSRWTAALSTSASLGSFAGPVARMGRTVCFAVESSESTTGIESRSICGRLRDDFDGATFTLPCRTVRFETHAVDYQRIRAERAAALANYAGKDTRALIERLDGLADEAREHGYPLVAIRLGLIAVHFLRAHGSAESLSAVRQRLEALPPWLGQPETSAWAAMADFERAITALEASPDGRDTWRLLAKAEAGYVRVAHPKRLIVTLKQAALLADNGAIKEAVTRLRTALDECERSPCAPAARPHARGELAWLILLDTAATDADLDDAEAALGLAIDALTSEHTQEERANQLLNRAFLHIRRGRRPDAALAEARALLESGQGGERAAFLLGWGDVARGLGELAAQNPTEALEACRGALTGSRSPALTAWALGCVGRAYREKGDLMQAQAAFNQALSLHRHQMAAQALGQSIPLGPGQQADDVYEAARVAIDLGHGQQAWAVLESLDHLVVDGAQRQRCRAEAKTESLAEEWRQIEKRRAALLQSLTLLSQPVAEARRAQHRSVLRSVMAELQALSRQWPGCEPASNPRSRRQPDYRAVPLDDEILLFERSADGRVALNKRTPFRRRRLVEQVARVREALDKRALGDDAWRALARPLADALVPSDVRALGPQISFALHGPLQHVPLAALPVEGADGERWLGELSTVLLVPAPARNARPSSRHGRSVSLFVVDPRQDLPSGAELTALYRRLFPDAVVLAGRQATGDAVGEALGDAKWLHTDAHGQYDPAFPELSSLRVADRSMLLFELAELPVPWQLANLSGCQTGRWPTTADSGRYGLAGLFARRGTRWIVATRAKLEDRLARDFNEAFYRGIKEGGSIPEAYRLAKNRVRETHPATAWAGLFLLSAAYEGAMPATTDSLHNRQPLINAVERSRMRPDSETRP